LLLEVITAWKENLAVGGHSGVERKSCYLMAFRHGTKILLLEGIPARNENLAVRGHSGMERKSYW